MEGNVTNFWDAVCVAVIFGFFAWIAWIVKEMDKRG